MTWIFVLIQPTSSKNVVSPALRPTIRIAWARGSPLRWADAAAIGGVEYDYYTSCVNGCGLYCYDGCAEEWIKLA